MSLKSQKYIYQPLKELSKSACDFYGVIYDATFPVQEDKDKEGNIYYSATIKVIDPDINCLTYPNNLSDHMVYLIVKAPDKEILPYVHAVGDIIRVHRGNVVSVVKFLYINIINLTLTFSFLTKFLKSLPKIKKI